jgi:hypothetical protein
MSRKLKKSDGDKTRRRRRRVAKGTAGKKKTGRDFEQAFSIEVQK